MSEGGGVGEVDERIRMVAVEGFTNIAKVYCTPGEAKGVFSAKVKATTLIDSLNAIITGQVQEPNGHDLHEKATRLLEMINGEDDGDDADI